MEKRLEGGCHCGRVRFAVIVRDLQVYDCNCSVCTKKGLLHLIVARGDFELLAGEDALTTYTFGTHTAQHTFCAHCGVQAFYTPRSHPDGIDVNSRCLDPHDLELVVAPFDGAEWERNVERIR